MTTPGKVSVLAVTPSQHDRSALEHIFSHSNWEIEFTRSLRDLAARVNRDEFGVVFTPERMPDGDWRDVLGEIESCQPSPKLLVVTDRVDGDTWAEVINRGGYDVLVKPFAPREVMWLVSQAWMAWRSDRQASPAVGAPLP